MAKEYHIIMGYENNNKLLDSNIVDFSSEDTILIAYKDNLAEGPLFDLRTLEGIEEREQYFAEFYDEEFIEKSKSDIVYFFKPHNSEKLEHCNIDVYEDGLVHESELIRKNSAKKLNTQLSEIVAGDSIYIWLGNESNEYVFKLAILHYFNQADVKLYDIDWSSVKYNIRNGGFVLTPFLSTCEKHQILDIKNQFRLVSQSTIAESAEQWKQLRKNNKYLRLVDRNLLIQEGGIDLLDNNILKECGKKFKSSSRIVGYVLGNLMDDKLNGLGDIFLFRRIQQLVEVGILEARNVVKREGSFDLFEVRLKGKESYLKAKI